MSTELVVFFSIAITSMFWACLCRKSHWDYMELADKHEALLEQSIKDYHLICEMRNELKTLKGKS